MRLIIVKRGALSTFRFLEQSCKDIIGLRVIWDRRRGAERRSEENADRRGEAPHSWMAADHVLAEVREADKPTDAGRRVDAAVAVSRQDASEGRG
jgi:hypothetical protein